MLKMKKDKIKRDSDGAGDIVIKNVLIQNNGRTQKRETLVWRNLQ